MKTIRIILLLLSGMACARFSAAQLTKSSKNIQELYDAGVKLKNDKKPSEALEKFKQVLAINPNHTESLYESGWCHNDLKNYSSAIDNLRKAREVWSATPKVYFELGYAFEKSGYNDSAIKCYNKCIELKPDYSLAHKQLGYIAYTKEDYNAALTLFRKYEEAAKIEIEDYLFWYRKGFTYNALKDYLNARISLEKSLKYKSDYINTWLELGFAAFKLKQDDEAIGFYTKAITLDPKSHIPYNGIAEVYRDNKKNIPEAMSWYKKTLAINPSERKANFGMGYCSNSQEKYTDAIEYLKKAIESERDYTAAFVELGYSYYKTGRDADALVQFDKAISLNPKNENSRYYACLVYLKQKNKAKAQKMVDELKALSSKHVATLQPRVDAL